MTSKQRIIIIFCLLVLMIPAFSMGYAQTVAVFPLEDLSLGAGSPNMEATRYLASRMELKGLKVIQEQDIMDFMASERINWLGYLGTEHFLRTREAMGADLVLLGTITKQSSSYGLVLTLVRTMDARTIWSSSDGLSLADTQRFLGLNQPATMDDLWPILINWVLESWPADISEALNRP